MMDWENLKGLKTARGNVVKVTCEGVLLWEKVISRLPVGYQEVEYIKADSNVEAFIDLGFAFDSEATIYMNQWLYTTGGTSYPFGATENYGKVRCCVSCPYSGMGFLYGSGATEFISSRVNLLSNNYGALNELVMKLKIGNLSFTNLSNNSSNVQYEGGSGLVSKTMTNNLYLFAQNYNGSPRFGGIRIISAFKYYDKNDNLICDLVPCYRKADGVIGMYDLARDLFFTNVGTGTFTKGADVLAA